MSVALSVGVAGIAAAGGARPSDGASKRSGSRYVLGDLLGRGGMAEVFAGYSVGDHGFQKPVAIKRLLPELANDEVFVDRLIEEAKLLVGMQHGNIVSVLDLAREGDDVFLVMEFVDGPSLRQLIKARGTRGLSLGVATYIAQSAAAGLEFAHARPGGAIIHADISPSNLLLTTSGEVRVADFGIARREGLGQGVVEGKWAYMAPEQARGESLTPRSDVFALGVVLYELLTGQHPFGRAVTPDQRDDQMRVIPPRVVKPTVPHGLDAICMRALAHDARDRYGRMQQMIDAVVEERFANGYRDGASDLAQAIREIAPRSDSGPRTMHTDRPVTIVTRSLLRDVTPARRPSHPPSHPASYPASHAPSYPASYPVSNAPSYPAAYPASQPPLYPLGPLDPPPRDEFPMQPTVAPTSAHAIDLPSARFPAVATEGVETLLRADEPPPGEFPMVPSSGSHTVARVVDQVAFAEAANAAAAILQLPSILRADGAPMPAFRMPSGVLPGDELASVVGGHTLTGHAAGAAAAVENRSYRWTILVLAAAALIGIFAAIASQLARGGEPSDSSSAPAAVPANQAPSAPAELPPGLPVDEQAAPVEPPAPPTIQPTVQPIQPTIAPTLPPTGSDEPAAQDSAAADAPAAAADVPAPAAAAPPTVSPTATTAIADPAQDGAPPAPPADGAPASLPPPAATVNSRPETARPAARRNAVRDSARRKAEPGILVAEAAPWAWVTVAGQRKETPGKFYLASGSYVVKFYNPDTGVAKSARVTVEPGKLVKLDQDMEP
jgi:serine/threonine protein kinase